MCVQEVLQEMLHILNSDSFSIVTMIKKKLEKFKLVFEYLNNSTSSQKYCNSVSPSISFITIFISCII